MTPEQVSAVQTSWKQVLPYAQSTSELFYHKLFDLDPALRQRFHGNLKHHGRALFEHLSRLITHLDGINSGQDTPPTAPDDEFTLRGQTYDSIGAALLWTLRAALGERFDAALAHAWTSAYTRIAPALVQACRPELTNSDDGNGPESARSSA
ncbi:MAG: hypothetical protein R3292_07750 [Alcanivorax sp.]|nr:hypothetical protein [Alcanivorax sp.]